MLRGKDYVMEIANSKALEIWGRKAEDVMHKPVFEAFPELKGQIFEALFSKVYVDGENVAMQETPVYMVRNGKPETIFINFAYEPLHEGGSVSGILLTAIDVTEQLLSRKKIEDSVERFRALAEESPMFVFIIEPDPAAPVSYWNKTWLNYTGQNEQEAKGRAWDSIIHPDDIQLVMNIYGPAFEKQQNYFIPAIRVKRHDGVYRWHSFKGNTRYLSNGDFNGYVGVGLDIHEIKLTEEALIESEEKFRLLAESMPQFVWTGNEKGELNYFNQAVYSYSGMSREDLERDGWLKIVHPDEREENVTRWMHSIDTGEAFHFEHRFRKFDGQYTWQLSRAIPQRTKEGKIQMWVGTSTEIQQQKELREQLEELVKDRTSDLLAANEALEGKNDELAKMNKELEAFSYVASHDLQEPLRKIQTFSNLILSSETENLTETGKSYFQRMQNAARRMQQLIEDLLAFSRTSTGDRKYELTDLNNVVVEVQKELKESIKEKQAVIETSALGKLNIIPFQFRQMLYNLISNAIKFSKQDAAPYIKIDSKIISAADLTKNNAVRSNQTILKDKAYCHITVKDNGIGFDPQYSERIFDMFQRLHGKNEFEGTGIGLAIVKKIAEIHNGFITATGELEKGATFNIYIPIT